MIHPAPSDLLSETRLLTAEEVAKHLKIGKSTVYLLCKRGELPHVAINRSIRIPEGQLRQWLERRTHGIDATEEQ